MNDIPEVVFTQYVVIRRDLPDLRKMIDIGHATGEAFFEFAPYAPPGFVVSKTTLVLRGARNENKLLKLEKQLIAKKISHAAIREPMAPWNNQLMAIALIPGDKEVMGVFVNEFQDLKLGEEKLNDS